MTILHTLAKTPTHAWIILAYLIYIGIKATKDRTVFIPSLFFIPAILTATKVKLFLANSSSVTLCYLLFLTVATFISFKSNKAHKIEKGTLRVHLKGSYTTLFVLLTFFATKYIFGYLKANDATLYQSLIYLDLATSGIFSGFFFGRAFSILSSYRKIITTH